MLAAGLGSVGAAAQEYPYTRTRPSLADLHQQSSLRSEYASDDFVVANFEKPLEIILNSGKLDDDKYIRTLAELANKAVQKITEEFPDKKRGTISVLGIETQVKIISKIMLSIEHKIAERFPKKDFYEVFLWKNIFPNDFLAGAIFINNDGYESIETIAERFKIDPKEINLFHTQIGAPIHAQLCHSNYSQLRSFLAKLFPSECVPSELVYRPINDPSCWALGYCFNGLVFLCPSRIKDAAEANDQSYYQEQYSTIANELLHCMMTKKFGIEGIKKVRNGREFAGNNFATEYTVINNREVEEACSDVVSMTFNPNSFIDMLRSPYPLSSALASKIVKEKFPRTFDHLKYCDWGQYSPQVIKEDFIEELKKQGVKKNRLGQSFVFACIKRITKICT